METKTQNKYDKESMEEACKNASIAFAFLQAAFNGKIDKRSKFEKFYDYMSNILFDNKSIFKL